MTSEKNGLSVICANGIPKGKKGTLDHGSFRCWQLPIYCWHFGRSWWVHAGGSPWLNACYACKMMLGILTANEKERYIAQFQQEIFLGQGIEEVSV